MSVVLKNITLKNFLSIGQVTQAVNFDSKELTLILGENLDLGGDGARNGTGKTTLIQGLSYVLFGTPINNIRKDNLINRTNGKNMLVTLEFTSNNVEYKIERGRRPNTLKFYINSDLQTVQDDAQGENKETQIEVERAIGMTSDMFKHVVALNTYTEPFLAMKANDQRNIIEQLLGITLLSEKAEIIKEKLRTNKENIQLEEFTVRAIEEANKRVQEQIDSLRRRQKLWQTKHKADIEKLLQDYADLSKINIEVELQSHKDLTVYSEKKKKNDAHIALLARQTAYREKLDNEVKSLQKELDKLNKVDIVKELQSHKELKLYIDDSKKLQDLEKEIARTQKEITADNKTIEKLKTEIEQLNNNKCYACSQDFSDHNHKIVLGNKQTSLNDTIEGLTKKNDQHKLLSTQASEIVLPNKKPTTHYSDESEAIKHSSKVENLQKQIVDKNNETDPYSEQISEYTMVELGPMPITYYDTESEAVEHKSTLSNLETTIQNKNNESDPYSEQLSEMEQAALQEINFNKINELTKLGEHLKFLLDLLTSKDSFVRKKIIDQNLSYLNIRLTHYLDKIGLPHNVVFKNDLSVEITELGRELDFDNLSRGERNRLILGLSFAFRDVWENLYFPINTLFVDELIDSGLDSVGVENSMAILKDMSRRRNKSIWLVSHRDELAGRVPSVLRVVKEGGFTSYSTSTEAG